MDILRQLWAPETKWINLIGMSDGDVSSDSTRVTQTSASVAMSPTATIL